MDSSDKLDAAMGIVAFASVAIAAVVVSFDTIGLYGVPLMRQRVVTSMSCLLCSSSRVPVGVFC